MLKTGESGDISKKVLSVQKVCKSTDDKSKHKLFWLRTILLQTAKQYFLRKLLEIIYT